MRRLQEAGGAAAKVMSEVDIFADPHVREREFFIETSHAESGTHLYPGHQWKASGTPLRADSPAPLLGEHNEYVYKELLGYSDEEYQRLTDELHIGSEFLPGLQLPGKI